MFTQRCCKINVKNAQNSKLNGERNAWRGIFSIIFVRLANPFVASKLSVILLMTCLLFHRWECKNFCSFFLDTNNNIKDTTGCIIFINVRLPSPTLVSSIVDHRRRRRRRRLIVVKWSWQYFYALFYIYSGPARSVVAIIVAAHLRIKIKSSFVQKEY